MTRLPTLKMRKVLIAALICASSAIALAYHRDDFVLEHNPIVRCLNNDPLEMVTTDSGYVSLQEETVSKGRTVSVDARAPPCTQRQRHNQRDIGMDGIAVDGAKADLQKQRSSWKGSAASKVYSAKFIPGYRGNWASQSM